MKVSELIGVLNRVLGDVGDCEIKAGSNATDTSEILWVSVAYRAYPPNLADVFIETDH